MSFKFIAPLSDVRQTLALGGVGAGVVSGFQNDLPGGPARILDAVQQQLGGDKDPKQSYIDKINAQLEEMKGRHVSEAAISVGVAGGV